MEQQHDNDDAEALISVAHEFSISIPDKESPSYLEFVTKVNDLVVNNFDKLISILYRLDVNESRLKASLDNADGKDAANIIAEMIIERQIQKIKSRDAFRKDNEDIDPNEKW